MIIVCNYIISFFVAFFLFNCAFADETNLLSSSIEDVNIDGKFISLGGDYLYTDEKNALLCVEIAPNRFSLWNPVDHSLTAPMERICSNDKELRPLQDLVGTISPKGRPPQVGSRDTSFAEAASIYVNGSETSNCNLNFATYYTVISLDGKSHSFYIIQKTMPPISVFLSEYCEASDGVQQNIQQGLDAVFSLHSFGLHNGKTLLYSAGTLSQKPIVLILDRIPDSIWSSNRSLFIIPKDLLWPQLNAAGGNIEARYKRVVSLISAF